MSSNPPTNIFLPLDNRLSAYLPALRQIESLLNSDQTEISISLIGTDILAPDLALAIWDILQSRPKTTKLVTKALSCLAESNVLIWLAGDVRLLRNDAWIVFTAALLAERKISPRIRNVYQESIPIDPRPTMASGFEVDDARIVELITRFLPPHLAHRRLWIAELSEWIEVSPTQKDSYRTVSKKYESPEHPKSDDEIPF